MLGKDRRAGDRMSRAGSSVVGPVHPGGSLMEYRLNQDQALKFEDPASALNMSDSRWNEIVQKDLADFKNENQRKVADKLARNKVIMEEQMKQI
jgi:hypothetical protein